MSDPTEELEKINRNLLQQLECPVCTNYLLPPIEQCKNGHSICQQCRVKVRSCPSCKVIFSGIRNRFAENIAETLQYPCENQQAGCCVTVLSKFLQLHQRRCQFRMYQCLAGNGSRCSWRGKRSDLYKHVQSEHTFTWIIGNKATLKVRLICDQSYVSHWLLLAHGEKFWLCEEYGSDSSVCIYARYIGPEKDAENYKYQIRFTSSNGNHELVNTHVTHCDFEEVTGQSQGVKLNYSLLKPYCDADDILTFTIQVTKQEKFSFIYLLFLIFCISVLYMLTWNVLYSYTEPNNNNSESISTALQVGHYFDFLVRSLRE